MTFPATSTLNAQTGAVIETQDLVTYQSLGVTRGLTLRYTSASADPRPILYFRQTGSLAGNQLLIAKMRIWRGGFQYNVPGYVGSQYGLTGGENFWAIPATNSGRVDGAFQADLSSQPSGQYTYLISYGVQPLNPTAPQFSALASRTVGSFTLVNRIGSSFGNGWALVGWQEIITNPDGSLLLLDGDGTQLLFDPPTTAGTVYPSPAGDFSRLERLADGTFRRTLQDRTVYSFTSQGKLATVQDRVGNLTRYTYDTNGLFTQITDPVGQITSFVYTTTNNVSRVTTINHPGPAAPNNRRTLLEYDTAGNLTQITHPDNAAYRYEYDSNRRMTASIDARSNRGQATYNFAGRATGGTRKDGSLITVQSVAMLGLYPPNQTIDPLAAPVAYSPNSTEAVTPKATYTDGNGNVTTMYLNRRGEIISSSDGVGPLPTQAFNAQNLLSQVTNARGQVTNYTYDSQGNLTEITDSLTVPDPANPSQRGRRYTYEPNFNQVTERIDELGRRTRYAYDTNNGNLLAQNQAGLTVGDSDDRVTTYAYKSVPNLSIPNVIDTIRDPLGRITTFYYSAQGLVSRISHKPASGAAEQTLQTFTYDAAGNVATFTDALGQQTIFTYDAFNRLTQVQQPNPEGSTAAGPITKLGYDPNGNLIRVEDALGNVTTSGYDAFNRLTQTTQADPDGTGPQTAPVTQYAYDPGGRLTSVTNPLNQVTRYGYDARDRLMTLTDARNQITRYAYDLDNNQISVTDPLNQIVEYGYDARDRLVRQTNARLTSQTTPPAPTTQFAYDAVDNLLSLSDPLSNVTRYVYDAFNQLVTETIQLTTGANPTTASRSYQYDSVSHLTRLTDRNGRVRTFGYDSLNRRTTENWLNSSGGVIQTITATYDLAGRLTNITDPNATYSHSYDALNRLTEVNTTGTPGIPATRLLATYNAVGSRLSLRDVIAGQVRGNASFGYDALQRLTAVAQTGTGIASKRVNFAYDALGQITNLSRFTSDANTPLVATNFSYGSTGLTTQVQHRLGATLLSDNAWYHDAAERVTRYTSPDGTSDYSYDPRDQLTVADHSYQTDETYSYDATGNRTNTGYTTSTYNRLTADGTFTYTYDNEGNRTQRSRTGEIVTYTWDHRNRLTRVEIRATTGGAISRWANYTYDAFDRRISKTVDPDGAGTNPAIVQRFVYDRDHIWLCFNDTNNVTHRYLYGPAVDMVLVEERSATDVRWPLADNQGTIRDVTNNAGAVQNHITYNSFGRFITQTNANVSTRFNYTGREFDGEAGLYYYRSRYYDPVVGRFIGEDAIGFGGEDFNLYRYVGNSPINWIDPFGLAANTGKCTYQQWKPLREKVVEKCKQPGSSPVSCNELNDPEAVKDSIRKFIDCIEARRNLTNTCFLGLPIYGKYNEEIENSLRGLKKCQERLKEIKREQSQPNDPQPFTLPDWLRWPDWQFPPLPVFPWDNRQFQS